MGTIFTTPTPNGASGTICKAGERVFAVNATRDNAEGSSAVRWLFLFAGAYGAGGVQLTASGIPILPGQNLLYPFVDEGVVLNADLTYRICDSATDPAHAIGSVTCNAQIADESMPAIGAYTPPLCRTRDTAPHEYWSIRNTL